MCGGGRGAGEQHTRCQFWSTLPPRVQRAVALCSWTALPRIARMRVSTGPASSRNSNRSSSSSSSPNRRFGSGTKGSAGLPSSSSVLANAAASSACFRSRESSIAERRISICSGVMASSTTRYPYFMKNATSAWSSALSSGLSASGSSGRSAMAPVIAQQLVGALRSSASILAPKR